MTNIHDPLLDCRKSAKILQISVPTFWWRCYRWNSFLSEHDGQHYVVCEEIETVLALVSGHAP
ncbi:hypothetical protein [Bartonella sp. B17]